MLFVTFFYISLVDYSSLIFHYLSLTTTTTTKMNKRKMSIVSMLHFSMLTQDITEDT